jgi:hypothetical protein
MEPPFSAVSWAFNRFPGRQKIEIRTSIGIRVPKLPYLNMFFMVFFILLNVFKEII